MKKKIIIGILIFLGIFWFLSYLNYKSSPKIAVIEVKGVISGYMDTVSNIDKAQKDSSIKAVVLLVDSPGGAVGAAQEIYTAIEKLRKTKPVVVSMGNVAASGGYYISAPANVIYANPGTITGSIGVIIQHVDASKVLDKIGIKIENIKSGQNKDILYPNHSLTPEQKRLLEATILDVYDQFLDAIVKYRPIKKEELKKYADGRIFSGKQAQKIGLVDKLGNIQDAINEAKKLSKMEGKKVQVIYIRKEKSFLQKLTDSKISISDILTVPQFMYLMKF
ncbi:signal peptide peptidase SppA [Persephonella sp. KM09-Lau-8]|uniref:signal peptide peptidase SppA n=1 Tax=Persephonella sp. KM09-Lau-8 TaxID=1158345 RepID=UPI0004958025|nr:signal peptide peptidase SppA [Persephonella sp. KM09-Lau-8]